MTDKPAASEQKLDGFGRLVGLDPRALSAFRVAFGLVLLGDLALRFPYRGLLYANEGVLPNHVLSASPPSAPAFSIYGAFSTRAEVTVAFLLTGLVYVAYTIGQRTRVMQVLVVLCLTGLVARNPLANTPGEPFLCAVALLTAFLPLGARFSVDAVQRDLAARRELAVHALGHRFGGHPRGPFTSVASLALFVQIAIVLALSGLLDHRDHGLHWALFHDAVATPLGGAIRDHAGLVTGLSRILQALSFGAAIAWVSPRASTRVASFGIACTGLSAAIFGALVCLGMFPFALAATALLLLTTPLLDRAGRRLGRAAPPATLVVSATDAGLFGVARVLARLDVFGKLAFVDRRDETRLAALPSPPPEGVVAVYVNGQWHLGTAAIAEAARVLPGGGFWAFLLSTRPLRALLRLVLRRRAQLARSWGLVVGAPFGELGFEDGEGDRPVREGEDVIVAEAPSPLAERIAHRLGAAREMTAGVLLLLIALAVPRDNPGLGLPAVRPPAPLAWILAYPRVVERGGLLTPFHEREDGALVIDLRLADGTALDPVTGLAPDRLLPLRGRFGASALWTAYGRSIRRPAASVYREELRRTIRGLARVAGRDARVVSGDILWVSRPSPEPGQPMQQTTSEEVLFGNR